MVGAQTDMTDRKLAEEKLKLNEARSDALLKLNQMTDSPLQEVMDFTLEAGISLTGSKIGYLFFASEDEKILTVHSWSGSALEQCGIADKRLIYSVETTGLWGEAVRQRRPIVTNDYDAPNPLKKGYPEGHVRVLRHMNIPVFDGERIVAVAGVANKAEPYDESDVRQLTLMMDAMWKLIQRKRNESEKKEMEARLGQAQKMQAIGTLAGGIAHDFNNILAAIIGYTEMAMGDIPQKSPLHDDLEQVLKAGYRARDLVKQILAFSRHGHQELKPVLIASIVEEGVKLLRASIPSTIEIRLSISCPRAVVNADATQIHQVLMNLGANAAHAMREKGGMLDIGLSESVIETDAAPYPELKPGAYVRLSVSDTGHGIEKANLHRIFDPYFTTKGPGEGTGLGLAAVHGIIERHGGFVSVYSEPGLGATFNILLPRVGDIPAATEMEEPVLISGGNERVLLVDDEEAIVAMVKKMLDRLGYRVSATTSASEALNLFLADPEGFDIIITDYTMPHMNGMDLAKSALNARPDIPIILATGFSEMVTEDRALATGIRAFVMKPISKQKIAETIRQAMSQRTVSG
jgi:signal transduction histidine kinase/ActR/RegA family two-component response regulator